MLYLILLIAACLRFIGITSLPISLFGDEVDVGYHAWSLITTGRDYMGHLLPTYIQSLSEWRAPLLMYFSAPVMGLLGPSVLSVRFMPALFGVLNIYLVYLLIKTLFNNRILGLFGGILLAITPWHIHFSRSAFEVTLLLCLVMGGVIFYLKGFYKLSFTLFALTFYTYSVANIFTPLLCLALYLTHRVKISKLISAAAISFIILLPIVYQIIFGQASGRFALISIFSDPKVSEEVIIKRIEPWVKNNNFEKIFHNKYSVIISNFGKNYLTSYSPQFLFISGDPRFRHSPGNYGELLWPSALLFIIGLYLVVKNYKNQEYRFTLYWLLLSPIPSSLTVDGGNHATRLFVMLPPLMIVCALGANFIYEQVHFGFKKASLYASIVSLAIFMISFVSYWHYYSTHYKYLSSKEWNNGYKEIFTQLADIQGSYKHIFINNTYQPSLLLYAFYTKLPPKDFQKMFHSDKVVSNVYPEFNGFLFGDNVYFGEATGPLVIDHITKDNGVYLAAQGREVPGNWNWIKDPPGGTKSLGGVYDVFGNPLFHLLTQFQNK